MGPEYLRASNGDGPAIRATVSSDRLPTDMDLITDSVANWPPKGIATSGTPDDDGVIIPDTECVFYYVLSGTIIHITGFAPGYSDVGHTENQIVILKPTTAWADELAEATDTIPDKVDARLLPIHTDEANGRVGINKVPENGRVLDIRDDAGAELRLSSEKEATLVIEADTDNVNEADVASIKLIQDGGAVTGSVGFGSGSQENDLVIKNDYSGGDIHLDTGGDIYSNGEKVATASEWSTWTPTFNNFTLGNGTVQYARYSLIGKTVNFRVKIALGSTSSVTGRIGISLPVAAHSAYGTGTDSFVYCTGMLRDVSASTSTGLVLGIYESSTMIGLGITSLVSGNFNSTSSSSPFSWANGDIIKVEGSYEAN